MLKSQRTRPESLEAHYGSAVPENALRALHRDGLLIHSQSFGDDVYAAPMAEVSEQNLFSPISFSLIGIFKLESPWCHLCYEMPKVSGKFLETWEGNIPRE